MLRLALICGFGVLLAWPNCATAQTREQPVAGELTLKHCLVTAVDDVQVPALRPGLPHAHAAATSLAAERQCFRSHAERGNEGR